MIVMGVHYTIYEFTLGMFETLCNVKNRKKAQPDTVNLQLHVHFFGNKRWIMSLVLQFYSGKAEERITQCIIDLYYLVRFNCPGLMLTSKTTNILHKMFSFWLHHNAICVFWNVKSRQCNVKPTCMLILFTKYQHWKPNT